FKAEDGIRDFHVTGVQTCALPISCQITSRHRKITRQTTIKTRHVKRILEDQTKITETNQTKTPMVINNKRTFFKIVALSAMAVRSEERRVGKECEKWRGRAPDKKK